MVCTKKSLFRQIFLLLITPLLLIPVVVSILNALPATAATQDETDRIRGWLSYAAAHECFHSYDTLGGRGVSKNSLGGRASKKEVPAGMWVVGRNAEGKVKCDTMIQAALPIWGYSSLEDLLMDAGYTYKSSDTNWHAPPDPSDPKKTITGQAIWDALRKKKGYTRGITDYLTSLEMYYLYHDSFVAGCGVTETTYSSASYQYKQDADGDEPRTALYTKLESNGTKVKTIGKTTGNTAYIYTSKIMLCSTLGDLEDSITYWAEKAAPQMRESSLIALYKRHLPSPPYNEEAVTTCAKEVAASSASASKDEQNKIFADCYQRLTGEDISSVLGAIDPTNPKFVDRKSVV
mgnify:FL=1